MAGFGRVAFEGEYKNQKVVNVFHFRSSAWLPGGGDPFTDVYAFLQAVSNAWFSDWRDCMTTDYKLNVLSGIGYNDDFSINTPSPLVLTINDVGTGFSGATNGAANCAIVSWRCGPQVQINGLVKSKRNRGYTAFGPLSDASVDEFSHISGSLFTALETLASTIMTPITLLVPAVVLQPIIIHEVWTSILGVRTLTGRTYTDIKGYAVRRVASFRRSRRPEA